MKNLTKNQRRVALVIFLNITIVVIESTVGVISGSLALLSDAWHNLSDVLALVVTAIALGMAARPASPTMTYGYVRSEMMATFINASFLSLLMVWVAVEAIDRLLHPLPVDGWLTMITAAAALIINTLSALILGGHTHSHEHHHDHKKNVHHDLNIRAAFWHMASDAILSLAVVLGGGAMIMWGITWIDSVLSLVFATVILVASSKLISQSFGSLMDRTDPRVVAKLSTIVINHPMVAEIHDVHLNRPSSKERFFSAHIVLEESLTLAEVESIIEALRHDLSHAGATHILLQPETSKYLAGEDTHCNGHAQHHHAHT